jgi:hypothetical protein
MAETYSGGGVFGGWAAGSGNVTAGADGRIGERQQRIEGKDGMARRSVRGP